MAEKVPIEDSLKHLLKCNVCLEEVNTLKALPCQHTICLTCVKQLTVRRQRFKCTICNKENPVPEGGFDNLADSLLTKQIFDLTKKTDSEIAEAPERTAESTTQKEKNVQQLSKRVSTPEGADGKGDSNLHIDENYAEDNLLELSNSFDEVKNKAEANYEEVKTMVEKCNEVLEKLPAQTQATKEAILKYKKRDEQSCIDKIEAVDDGARAFSGELSKKISMYEPCFEKVGKAKAALIEAQKLLSNKGCSRTAFADAQKQLDDLRSVMASVTKTWTEVGEFGSMKKGASVRLILNREFLTPEYKKKLVASDVTYSSVGIFGGKIIEYSGTETDMQGVSDVYVWVIFPEDSAFLSPPGSLVQSVEKAKNLPYIGSKVRLKKREKGKSYPFSDKLPAEGSHGVLKNVTLSRSKGISQKTAVFVIVDFADVKDWCGNYNEIELVPGCGFEVGDKVRASRRVREPSTGWNGINGSSVGIVKSVKGSQGREKVTVEFPENESWRGLATDLELVRGLNLQDEVQVKLTVKKPRLDWGGVSHKDVGTLVDITNRYDSLGKVAEVQFLNKPKWFCLLEELEPSRYQPPFREKCPEEQFKDFVTSMFGQL